MNILLSADSYKYSHYLQYPKDTTYINSYIEARKSSDPDMQKVVFFGLQMAIMKYLSKPFTKKDIDEAEEVIVHHGLCFNRKGFNYILKEYDGFFPVVIESLKEGMVVPVGTPLVQVRNVDPKVPWVTSFLETLLLQSIWYPTTVASYSYAIKQILLKYAEKSGSDPAGVAFKLHDFGCRGVSSYESAEIGGLAHLVNFMGTDTVPALVAGQKYYGSHMAGFSIPAAEHSTMTILGPKGELDAFRNMLTQFAKPGALVAVVSDSYDIMNATDNYWGKELKQEVLNSEATIVVRPDSGDPTRVPLDVIKSLMNSYGYTVNDKGYSVLHPSVRVIQGDGINKDSIKRILANMDLEKLALDNIAFGMGGALLQAHDRDEFSFAMKATSAVVGGKSVDIQKNPVTDPSKKSKTGILSVANKNWTENYLRKVWQTNVLYNSWTLDEIRKNTERVYEKEDLIITSV